MRQPTIILLNGTSSAGKSCIAQALQDLLDEPYLHTGIDHFLLRWPTRYHVLSSDPALPMSDGFHWLLADSDQELLELRIGPLGRQLITGMYHAVYAFVAAGNHAIIDDVIFDPYTLSTVVQIFHATNTLFVGVRCPYEVAVQREKERSDRQRGLVRAHYHHVHAHAIYDLEVDTSVLNPTTCAQQIMQRLAAGPAPAALSQLYNKLQHEEKR